MYFKTFSQDHGIRVLWFLVNNAEEIRKRTLGIFFWSCCGQRQKTMNEHLRQLCTTMAVFVVCWFTYWYHCTLMFYTAVFRFSYDTQHAGMMYWNARNARTLWTGMSCGHVRLTQGLGMMTLSNEEISSFSLITRGCKKFHSMDHCFTFQSQCFSKKLQHVPIVKRYFLKIKD